MLLSFNSVMGSSHNHWSTYRTSLPWWARLSCFLSFHVCKSWFSAQPIHKEQASRVSLFLHNLPSTMQADMLKILFPCSLKVAIVKVSSEIRWVVIIYQKMKAKLFLYFDFIFQYGILLFFKAGTRFSRSGECYRHTWLGHKTYCWQFQQQEKVWMLDASFLSSIIIMILESKSYSYI